MSLPSALTEKELALDLVRMLATHRAHLAFPPGRDPTDVLLVATPAAMRAWRQTPDVYTPQWVRRLATSAVLTATATSPGRHAVFYFGSGGDDVPTDCIVVLGPAHPGDAVVLQRTRGVPDADVIAFAEHVLFPALHKATESYSTRVTCDPDETRVADSYLAARGTPGGTPSLSVPQAAALMCGVISAYDPTPAPGSAPLDEQATLLRYLLDHAVAVLARAEEPETENMKSETVRGEVARAWAVRLQSDPGLAARERLLLLDPEAIDGAMGKRQDPADAAAFIACARAVTRPSIATAVRVLFLLRHADHWSLLAFDTRSFVFTHLDSLGNGVLHDAYAEAVANAFITNMEYVPPCAFRALQYRAQDQQRTADCGLCTLGAVQLVLSRSRGELAADDAHSMVFWCDYARRQLAGLAPDRVCAEVAALLGVAATR